MRGSGRGQLSTHVLGVEGEETDGEEEGISRDLGSQQDHSTRPTTQDLHAARTTCR